jgi:TPP-dependent trihydroxycyclohexane-1,2-dione (THcHDO) dehydratase
METPEEVLNSLGDKFIEGKLTWWNVAVMALSRDRNISASQAAKQLSSCWISNMTSEIDGDDIQEIADLNEDVTWWNVALLAFSKDNNINAIKAAQLLSPCW